MTYDRQILAILSDVGDNGINVQTLAKHVYNMNCTLFAQPDFSTIHRYVQQYLLRNSKSKQSIIESTGRRGYYRLNTKNSDNARQLMLEFNMHKEENNDKEETEQQDLSLCLFDFE